MTDLLGLLAGIHRAVNELGDVHLTITDVEGQHGAVDCYTRTIHISPGLTLPEMLQVLAEAVDVLTPVAEGAAPIAVGGEVAGGSVPAPRHLSVVRPDALLSKRGRTALTSDML